VRSPSRRLWRRDQVAPGHAAELIRSERQRWTGQIRKDSGPFFCRSHLPRVSETLVRYAQGVDLLVHEVFVPETLQRAGVPPARAKNIIDYHTTAEQAGNVFARTKPKLAVYSHVCMPTATDEDLLSPTRRTYSGPVEIGEDLMTIDVGDAIRVTRTAKQ